ncbi:hypothetical protein [Acinetobacter bereziniae]|uniref:hypothetical protein n=1 Tax=Acinetobacter bereziniae TaxID=106648 RepID=UPI00124FD792|nr:hypothetical protein [Acinetobacter bereziniae]
MKEIFELLFRENTKGNMLLKKPSNKLIKADAISTDFDKYDMGTVNRLFRKTQFILINPNSASIDQIDLMVEQAHQRMFIPVFTAHGCNEDNYKTLSFGVYEASNFGRNENFIFAYLSNHTDIMEIEDSLEDKDYLGRAVLHGITDLFAVQAGSNHAIVCTINTEKIQKFFNAIENKK